MSVWNECVHYNMLGVEDTRVKTFEKRLHGEVQTYSEVKNLLGPVEPLILDEIRTGDDVNLQKFTDICDLFLYLPAHKQEICNSSKNMFYVLSSNT